MNYADGTKHDAASGEEIRTTSKLQKEKSDAQKVFDDVASDDIFQSVTCEEGAKDKDKISKGDQATERVENSQKGGKEVLDSGGESERNEKEKHALGFYRVLRNPVKINGDGSTKQEMDKVNTADKDEEKRCDVDEQDGDDRTKTEDEEKNGNESCEKGEAGNSSESDQSDAPIALDEDFLTTLTEVSSDGLTDDNEELSGGEEFNLPDDKSDGISLMETNNLAIASKTESSDLIQMEKELKVVEVKFGELAKEIELLEKYIEAGAGEIENLEFELTKVEAECDKKLQHKEDLEKHLREDDRSEVTIKVISEQINNKGSISCIEDRSKEEMDDADNEEMENGETSKTEEETFFSLTPSEVSEDEKTFNVKLETTDVATETVEDDISARVEENHSDLLLNCLVRYQPWCPAFPALFWQKLC